MGKNWKKWADRFKGHKQHAPDDKEVKNSKETLRIVNNIGALLNNGLFGGSAAAAVFEAQAWLKGMVNEIKASIPAENEGEKNEEGKPLPAAAGQSAEPGTEQ